MSATQPDAWVALPTEDQIRAGWKGPPHPYVTFMSGVVPRMSRLIMAHDVIGPALGQLGRTLLFGPGFLSRPEREMVASVAAAAQDCHY